MTLRFENRYRMLFRRSPTHLYLHPHSTLCPFVAHYTLCLGGGPPASVPTPPLVLIPDVSGCFVFAPYGEGLWGHMYGPTTAAVTVQNDLGVYPLRFFVEFRPGGLRAFTPIPQWELADRILPLGEVEVGLDALITRCWHTAPDLDEFVLAVDRALCAHCTEERPLPAALLRAVTPSVAALAEESGYSPRHLSRLFREGCGVSPKAFSRVLRINAALRRMETGIPLTTIAQDLGYFDQPHFIHAFRSVCGVSPTAYLATLSGFYNEPLKF